jgi:predicted nucleic acid-binding protein
LNAYFDAAYLVKLYVTDPDSAKVREMVGGAETISSSALCLAEVSCALHRGVRERTVTHSEAARMRVSFSEDVERGIVRLIPVSDGVLRTVETMISRAPASMYLRAGDAIYLASAQLEGFSEIWSNDKHMLRAAPHFGVKGRSV